VIAVTKPRSCRMTDGLPCRLMALHVSLSVCRRARQTEVLSIERACTRVAGRSLLRHGKLSTTSFRKMSDGGITGLWTTSKLPAKRTNRAINGVSPFASTYSGSL
jgi:hypothetical protein